MEMPSLVFYANRPVLNAQVVQVGYVPEEVLEIFDLIQGFQSSEGFSCWVTNQNFKNDIYKSKIIEGKYNKEWGHLFEKKSFFFGKLELDENKISKELENQLLSSNSTFHEIERQLELEKLSFHSLLTESHYTVISHIIFQEEIIGRLWEIYNLSNLLKIYAQKEDPLRYWRKIRKE